MSRETDEWRDRLSQMHEVPFSDALRSRILDEARQISKSEPRRTVPWKRARLPWIAGVAVVALTLVAWSGSGAVHFWQSVLGTSDRVSEATAVTSGVPFASALARAPIRVEVHVGSLPGKSTQNVVYATLTNEADKPIEAKDVFGLLGFQATHTVKTVPNEDPFSDVGLTFVNPPVQTLNPGQTVTWSFQPEGADVPHDGMGNLIAVPKLSFFFTKPVLRGKADVVVRPSGLAVTHILWHPRYTWKTNAFQGESVEVSADLTNATASPIRLINVRALVVFTDRPGVTWTESGVHRFAGAFDPLDHVTEVIAPGKTVPVYLRMFGSAGDFAGPSIEVYAIWR